MISNVNFSQVPNLRNFYMHRLHVSSCQREASAVASNMTVAKQAATHHRLVN